MVKKQSKKKQISVNASVMNAPIMIQKSHMLQMGQWANTHKKQYAEWWVDCG